MQKKYKLLIVDDFEDILEILSFYIEDILRSAQVFKAQNGTEAKAVIDAHPDLDLIICDYNMPQGNGGEVFAHFRLKSDKPFVVHSSDSLDMHPEFKDGKNLEHLPKPVQVSTFNEIVTRYLKEIPDPSLDEISFVAVALPLLHRIRKSPAPMYIKLGDDHFVRTTHEGHVFDLEEIQKYQNRKISRLYLERTFFPEFIQHLESQFSTIINQPILDSESYSLARASLNFLEQARDQLGLTPEIQSLTNKNINMVLGILENNPNFASIIQDWNSSEDSFFADRSTLIALIATSVSTKLKWSSELTAQKLVFASMLHDISLSPTERKNQPQLMADLKKSKPPYSDELKHYRNHSVVSAELMRKWPLCPPDVDIIILQHHESADGVSGFPMKLDHTRLSPLSTVFILSLDLAEYVIAHAGKKKIEDWIQERRELYSHGEFKKVFNALLTNPQNS